MHGGSSGIGTTAIQLAKAFGARVITTAGSEEKCEACRKLGADVAVNYKTEDFVAATKAATGDKGADVILDMVGGDYIARNYEAAAVEGRIVQIAFQGGPKAEVNFMRLMLKRLHHTGSTLRSRSVADKGAIARAVEDNVLPLIAAGKVKPVIYKTFPLARGRRRPCADGNERPYRQDRANRLTARLISLPAGAKAGIAGPRNRRNVAAYTERVDVIADFHRRLARSAAGGIRGRRSRLTLVRPSSLLALAGVAAGAARARRRSGQRAARRLGHRPHRRHRTAEDRHRPHPGLHRARPRRHRAPHRGARARSATPTGRCSRSPIIPTSRSTG